MKNEILVRVGANRIDIFCRIYSLFRKLDSFIVLNTSNTHKAETSLQKRMSKLRG
jgi:hypothetical protein